MTEKKENMLSRLKLKASKLKKFVTAVYYAGKHPDLPGSTRVLVIITVAYALSPVDLIPDFIPVLGYLDDLIILPALITLCIKRIPDDIMAESLKKAEEQPLSLKKNWKAGILFIGIWIAIAARIVLVILKRS